MFFYIEFVHDTDFAMCCSRAVLLYGCTTWNLKKHLDIRLDLYKDSKCCPELILEAAYGYLPYISQIIWIKRRKHNGHSW